MFRFFWMISLCLITSGLIYLGTVGFQPNAELVRKSVPIDHFLN